MYILFIILGTVLCLIILLFFMKLTIETEISIENEDFFGEIRFFLYFRWLGYKLKIPSVDIDEESPAIAFKEEKETLGKEKEEKKKFSFADFLSDVKAYQNFLRDTVDFYRIIEKFLTKISVVKFTWNTKIGLEEADKTGAACGVIWGIKGTVLGVISKCMKVKVSPQCHVDPLFQQLYLSTVIQCMVSFRIGYAILTAVKVLIHKRRIMATEKNDYNQSKGRNIHV